MAECFEKIGEELAELFIERMSWAVWIYSDLFGECWYCFGILDSKLVCEVGKTSWELDACVSSFEKKKLAIQVSLFCSTVVRTIIVFPMPAIPFSQNTHLSSLSYIHFVISLSTLVCVFSKHDDIPLLQLHLWFALIARGRLFTSDTRSSQCDSPISILKFLLLTLAFKVMWTQFGFSNSSLVIWNIMKVLEYGKEKES